MIIRFAFLFAILTLSIGCGRPQAEAEVALTSEIIEHKPSFSITDSTGKTLIDASQIRSYEWASHTLTLRPGVRNDLHKLLAGTLAGGHPFAVNSNGKVVYRGNFTTSLSSLSLNSIVINLFPPQQLGEDQIQIRLGYPTKDCYDGEDLRQSEVVKDTLQALGKML